MMTVADPGFLVREDSTPLKGAQIIDTRLFDKFACQKNKKKKRKKEEGIH